MCCASRCVCLDGQATYWVCGYANRQHELAEEIGDLEPFNVDRNYEEWMGKRWKTMEIT